MEQPITAPVVPPRPARLLQIFRPAPTIPVTIVASGGAAVTGVAPLKVLGRQNCAPRFVTYGCAVGLERVTTAIDTGMRQALLDCCGLDWSRIRAATNRRGTCSNHLSIQPTGQTESRQASISSRSAPKRARYAAGRVRTSEKSTLRLQWTVVAGSESSSVNVNTSNLWQLLAM